MILLLMYGAGMIAVILFTDNGDVQIRMITAFSSMFSGILGLGAGYLLGRTDKPQ